MGGKGGPVRLPAVTPGGPPGGRAAALANAVRSEAELRVELQAASGGVHTPLRKNRWPRAL